MQQFAAWTQLAETTFLTSPESDTADYAGRIFTTDQELPFAGHPTLGSCAAWLAQGNAPMKDGVVVQECGVGPVEIDITGERPAFVAPETSIADVDLTEIDDVLAALGLEPTHVVNAARLHNGPDWLALEIDDAAKVEAFEAAEGFGRYPDLKEHIGVFAKGGTADFTVRMFSTQHGFVEDPVTGSLNAALAFWRNHQGRLPASALVTQGRQIGRDGVIEWTKKDDTVRIGGTAEVLIKGMVRL